MKRLVVVVFVVFCVVGFLGYTVYGEWQAISNLRVRIWDVSLRRVGLTSADLVIGVGFYNSSW